MATDPEVFRALDSFLQADPSNTVVRLHLAELLAAAGEPAQALGHLDRILAAQPDNVAALELAANAADATGDRLRSLAWRRVSEALASHQQTDPPTADRSPANPRDTVERQPAPAAESPAHESPRTEPIVGDEEEGSGTDWDAEMRELLGKDRGQRVTLADVGGLEPVKDQLEKSFLGPMRKREMREAFGASMRGGILLWGPPGCGKTFLARAVAGELGARFASVGLHDVLDMWLGNSEKKLHELFAWARRHTPSVLFFDELDAIGHARSNLRGGAGRNVVAQLLVEMDGLDNANDGLFLIGATNQPWDVDPAFRRPGRLDRMILVLPPDPPARNAILDLHLRGRPTAIKSLAEVVAATDQFSGADLKLVCEDAAERALAESVGRGAVQPITEADLLAAVRGVRPSTNAWMEVARNYATYGNSSGEYDELVSYLRNRRRPRR